VRRQPARDDESAIDFEKSRCVAATGCSVWVDMSHAGNRLPDRASEIAPWPAITPKSMSKPTQRRIVPLSIDDAARAVVDVAIYAFITIHPSAEEDERFLGQ